MTAQAIVALRRIHKQVESVLQNMSDDDWQAPSLCDGWRVQEVFAHISSNMLEIVEPSPPPPEGSPELASEERMEALVSPRRGWSPQQVLDEYDEYFDGWIAALSALQDEPLASSDMEFAELGTYPMHFVANAFAFDHYCHFYVDVLAPEGPLTLSVPQPDADTVRPGIDWMLAGLPQMQREELPQTVSSPIRLDLTGPGGGSWTFTPPTSGDLISVVEDAPGEAAVIVTSSAHDFVSWGTKRSDWRDACELAGDRELAAQFLDALNIV